MEKTAVITGADGGMGSEITKAVAQAGYHVIMLCHNRKFGEQRMTQLSAATGNPHIEVKVIELSSMKSVQQVAHDILDSGVQIDLLMNNAGTMGQKYVPTVDGFENTVAVNYLAPYLLTRLLLPAMHQGSRIVNMVSCTYAIGKLHDCFFEKGKRGAFLRIPIYSNTKLALWLFTRELSKRVSERGITVNASDPGIVSTNIIRMNMWFDPLTDIFFRPFIRSPRQGADTAIKLLLDEKMSGITGQMYASCRQRAVKPNFMEHPQAESLWNETQKRLSDFLK